MLQNIPRPINVISGTRPPSVYNIVTDGKASTASDSRSTLTSFYLPADTVKSLHVTSETTTKDVIRSLLGKFRVADTPHKYALYEKTGAAWQEEEEEEDVEEQDDDGGDRADFLEREVFNS